MATDTDSDYTNHTTHYNDAVTAALDAAVEAAEARAAYIGSDFDKDYADHADVTQAIFEDKYNHALKLRNTVHESRIFGTVHSCIENGFVHTVASVRDRWVGQTQPWVIAAHDLNQDIDDTRYRLASLEKRRRKACLTALDHGATLYQIAAVTGCDLDEVQDWLR